MAPPSLACVISTAGTVTLRAAESRSSGSNHEDPNLLIRMGNFDSGYLPRTFHADQLGVVLGD
jgi:hypothetical protein